MRVRLPLVPGLQPQVLVHGVDRPLGRMIHGPNGDKTKPDTVRNVLIQDVLTPLAARFSAGAYGPGILAGRVHGLCHYFCSISADRNVSEQTLMSWLGHRENEMIRCYYRPRNAESKRQMSLLPLLDRTATEPQNPPSNFLDGGKDFAAGFPCTGIPFPFHRKR